ncbi:MAG: segregation/condensation protein A [Erysipelotrichaceae bacterium]|jgi:segregation and condensation protein A|nr:segregation/condensation protein A [Erysipelotrichaceae bacterium]
MTFTVTINDFEGPLDLMLDLIRKNNMDLFELDITLLTTQYAAFLHQMEEMHLEIASEYLSELAGLIEYKSRRLLPKEKAILDGEYEEDPKDRLVRRLLEYQQFKEISETLGERYRERLQQLSRPMEAISQQWLSSIDFNNISGSVYDLTKAMGKALDRYVASLPLAVRVTKPERSVDDCIYKIRQHFDGFSRAFSFDEVLDTCIDLEEGIVSFLAVLDLIRVNLLVYTMDKDDRIWLKWGNA